MNIQLKLPQYYNCSYTAFWTCEYILCNHSSISVVRIDWLTHIACAHFSLALFHCFIFLRGPSWSRSYGRFTSTCTYHNWRCEFEPRSWRDVLDTTLCCKVRQWLQTDRWFPPDTLVSFTNKSYLHDITVILLKVALIIILSWCWLNMVPEINGEAFVESHT